MNIKKIIILIIISILILAGVYFMYSSRNLDQTDDQQSVTVDANLIVSDYGFSFSVPSGWYIWEGYSAATLLQEQKNFLQDVKRGLTAKEIKNYQSILDGWSVKSAKTVAFTDKVLDHENRNLADMGIYMSTPIDSPDTLEYNTTLIEISDKDINFEKKVVSDERGEDRNIQVQGSKARFLRIKSWSELYDYIVVRIPIDAKGETVSKSAKSLIVTRWVEKDNPSALDELVKFVSALNISY